MSVTIVRVPMADDERDTMSDVDHTSPVREDVDGVFARGRRTIEESEEEEE